METLSGPYLSAKTDPRTMIHVRVGEIESQSIEAQGKHLSNDPTLLHSLGELLTASFSDTVSISSFGGASSSVSLSIRNRLRPYCRHSLSSTGSRLSFSFAGEVGLASDKGVPCNLLN